MTRRLCISLTFLVFMLAVASPASAQLMGGGTINVNQPISGVFNPMLPIDSSGKPFIDYQFVVQVPGTYQIDLRSSNTSAYDPYLVLMQNGRRIASNDDGGGNLQSRISRFLNPGYYTVRVTRFGTGPVMIPTTFTLSVTAAVMSAPPPVVAANFLTDAMARVLATQYYNTQSEWAGQYVITINRTRLIPMGPNAAQVHVNYNYSCIRNYCSGGPAGVDQRVFYFQRYGPSWRVVRMGGHMSASF